jgi:hypothetical protein
MFFLRERARPRAHAARGTLSGAWPRFCFSSGSSGWTKAGRFNSLRRPAHPFAFCRAQLHAHLRRRPEIAGCRFALLMAARLSKIVDLMVERRERFKRVHSVAFDGLTTNRKREKPWLRLAKSSRSSRARGARLLRSLRKLDLEVDLGALLGSQPKFAQEGQPALV